MKDYMSPGEYTKFAKKTFRCVADKHSPMKRCILCDLRPYGICDFVRCQPDERDDRQGVVFRLTKHFRKNKETKTVTSKINKL